MQRDVFIINCDVVRADIQSQWMIKGLEHNILAIIILWEGISYRGCQNRIHLIFYIMVTLKSFSIDVLSQEIRKSVCFSQFISLFFKLHFKILQQILWFHRV